jgi:hypothetical protein
MMRADDAAGERGGPGDEQDPAGPRFPHGARRALGEQERGAQVHRQHLIELGGGDVLQRMEMAQPGVAGQHSTSAGPGASAADWMSWLGPAGGAGRRRPQARCRRPG